MRLKSSVALTVMLMAAACGAGPRGPGIAVGIGYLTLGNELTESHIQTLVTVLTTVANDVENPDPRA